MFACLRYFSSIVPLGRAERANLQFPRWPAGFTDITPDVSLPPVVLHVAWFSWGSRTPIGGCLRASMMTERTAGGRSFLKRLYSHSRAAQARRGQQLIGNPAIRSTTGSVNSFGPGFSRPESFFVLARLCAPVHDSSHCIISVHVCAYVQQPRRRPSSQ